MAVQVLYDIDHEDKEEGVKDQLQLGSLVKMVGVHASSSLRWSRTLRMVTQSDQMCRGRLILLFGCRHLDL